MKPEHFILLNIEKEKVFYQGFVFHSSHIENTQEDKLIELF